MSTDKIYNTSSAVQTQKLGERFAKKVLKKQQDRAFIVGLRGDLGGGKTTFAQGMAKGLGIKHKILSPTFVILKKFKITNQNIKISKYQNFFHIDCYRISQEKEILNLGFEEIIANPKNIVVIEWASKIKNILPKNTIWIDFEFKTKSKRKIVFFCG